MAQNFPRESLSGNDSKFQENIFGHCMDMGEIVKFWKFDFDHWPLPLSMCIQELIGTTPSTNTCTLCQVSLGYLKSFLNYAVHKIDYA